MSEYKVGDRVSVMDDRYPGMWVVKSMGPVNAVLAREQGGNGVRAPHYMVGPVTEETKAVVPGEFYELGELVEIHTGRYAGLYAVIADKGAKVNLAKLGGDGGRYVRMPKSSLNMSRVAVEAVLK